jgi:hypothetical protein
MTITEELRALAGRVPDGSPPARLARQRAADAAEVVAAALSTDPTLAERQRRRLDVLPMLLRRLISLARQATAAIESERLATAGQSTAHLGLINTLAAEELDAASARCPVIASEAWPDWNTERRILELSASRMPHEDELADIADRLRRAVAPALDLVHPHPDAVRLAALADQIAPQTDKEV